MRFLKITLVIGLALLLSGQLVLHNHSLIPEGNGSPALVCPVCAFGAERATIVDPLGVPPVVIVSAVVAVAVADVTSAPRRAASSRGPPLNV